MTKAGNSEMFTRAKDISTFTSIARIIQTYYAPRLKRNHSPKVEVLIACYILSRCIRRQRFEAWVENITASIVIEHTHETYPIILEWISRYFENTSRVRAVPAKVIDNEELNQEEKSSSTGYQLDYGTYTVRHHKGS